MFEEIANIAALCALMGAGILTFLALVAIYLYFVEDL
jgi:hypothetical protein